MNRAFSILFAIALAWCPTAGGIEPPAATAPATPPAAAAPPLDGRDGRELLLRNFRPRPALQVPQNPRAKAAFPVIDVHTHFRHRFHHEPAALDQFLAVMDRNQVALCVSLDGQLGEDFAEHAKYLAGGKSPDRFAIFANLNWIGAGKPNEPATWDCQRPDFAHRMALALKDARVQGACGLKLFKQFGLEYRNLDGSLIKIDDPRWDPIWRACGELGLPVIIHTADPVAFFQPINETNERWEELSRHPDWSFYDEQGKFPRRQDLLDARNRVIERHPQTTFIGAHVANSSEDLTAVARWLEAYPNLVVEFASRINELGRQPYTARKFFLKYQDRILFGTDGPWPEARLALYWRFLETFDENFPYSEKEFPPQGLWNIHGIGLPDEVLKKVYHENALRIIPGLKEKFAKWQAHESSERNE